MNFDKFTYLDVFTQSAEYRFPVCVPQTPTLWMQLYPPRRSERPIIAIAIAKPPIKKRSDYPQRDAHSIQKNLLLLHLFGEYSFPSSKQVKT